MKRQRFRLGGVLRHYELQRQRAEQDLQQASRKMREIDEEIEKLHAELAALATCVDPDSQGLLSVAGWIACGRRSEYLGRCLEDAQVRHHRQVAVVAQCAEARKRWAIAEETLLSLRRKVESANLAKEEKTRQVQLQETMLRRWLNDETE